MTTNNAPGLHLESGEFVPAAELNQSPSAAVPTSATSGDWMKPTTVAQRLGDVLQLLCGGRRPSDAMVAGWLDKTSEELQSFCANHGPAWAQGIGLIDAAMVMVDQPTDILTPHSDRDHERTDDAQRPAIEFTEKPLYWRLHDLSTALEGGGRIDEHEQPDAYKTILDAMQLAAQKGGA